MLKHLLMAVIEHLTRLDEKMLAIERFFSAVTPILERFLHVAVQGSVVAAFLMYVIVVIVLIWRFLIQDLIRLLA